MATDELRALLESRGWVTRRVDRVEFLDLTTVRRTINLTVHAGKLRRLLPERRERPHGDVRVPLGWFLPWANAGAVLLDGHGRVIPYMTSAESDELVTVLVERRLERLAIEETRLIELVEKIPKHRKDPAEHGHGCPSCDVGEYSNGHLYLMAERWGCRAVRELLEAVYARREGGSCDRRQREVRELAMILLAWQTNFVLLAPLSELAAHGEWAILRLSFDEELRRWDTPSERGKKAEEKGVTLTRADRKILRGRISRGGPFSKELDGLFPRRLRGVLARRSCQRLSKIGRRGLLGLTWHVAWHQASGIDTPAHQVDVILPDEMMAVRVRMLRKRDSDMVAHVADQVGSHATIVAPEVDCAKAAKLKPPPPPPPTLFSLSITQRSTASWTSGAGIALLTGVAVLATAVFWLPTRNSAPTDAVTMLIVAPTLVAALLSVRAKSELAEQLTATLRLLIGAVGLLAAVCAIGILAHEADKLTRSGLEVLWIVCSVAMLGIAASLFRGAVLIRRFIEVGRRAAPRAVPIEDINDGRSLNPRRKKAPRISPPDLWLDADEGELVPWGWLDGKPDEPKRGLPLYADEYFWPGGLPEDLMSWVQEIFCYKPSN